MENGIVVIPADIREFDGYVWHASPSQYVNAAIRGAHVQPLIVPSLEEGFDADRVLDRVDGVLVSGYAPTCIRASTVRKRRKAMAPSTRPVTPPA